MKLKRYKMTFKYYKKINFKSKKIADIFWYLTNTFSTIWNSFSNIWKYFLLLKLFTNIQNEFQISEN